MIITKNMKCASMEPSARCTATAEAMHKPWLLICAARVLRRQPFPAA